MNSPNSNIWKTLVLVPIRTIVSVQCNWAYSIVLAAPERRRNRRLGATGGGARDHRISRGNGARVVGDQCSGTRPRGNLRGREAARDQMRWNVREPGSCARAPCGKHARTARETRGTEAQLVHEAGTADTSVHAGNLGAQTPRTRDSCLEMKGWTSPCPCPARPGPMVAPALISHTDSSPGCLRKYQEHQGGP